MPFESSEVCSASSVFLSIFSQSDKMKRAAKEEHDDGGHRSKPIAKTTGWQECSKCKLWYNCTTCPNPDCSVQKQSSSSGAGPQK